MNMQEPERHPSGCNFEECLSFFYVPDGLFLSVVPLSVNEFKNITEEICDYAGCNRRKE